MKIPAFWSKATAEEVGEDGNKVFTSCWRWSDTSQDDARQSALAVARSIVARLVRGQTLERYGYGRTPLREETIRQIANAQGEPVAAVTQNAYGCFVLNTARVMFVDIDFPPAKPGEQLGQFFGKLLGRRGPSPEEQRETAARQHLEAFLRHHDDWGVRLYRTAAGLRVMVTHDLFDPEADVTRQLLEALGSDPLYVRLCRTQQCFRARLTPKPWRCGHWANSDRWPRESDAEQKSFDQWQADYMAKQANYATCRLVGTLGQATVHPEVDMLLEVHDHFTRASDSAVLA